MAPVLDRRAHPLVRRPRHRPRQPAPLRAPAGEALPLLQAHRRHRVPLRLRRHASGASSRASPTAPTSTSRTHSEHSGQDLSYFDQATDERYMPYVIEPAAGLTRSLMAFLVDAYTEDEAPNTKGGVDKRTVLRSTRGWRRSRSRCCRCRATPTSRRRPATSPPSCASSWNVDFDDAGAIGRRYRRQDEIGTPYCVTVDFDTLEDDAVTVRERDTMAAGADLRSTGSRPTSPSVSSAADAGPDDRAYRVPMLTTLARRPLAAVVTAALLSGVLAGCSGGDSDGADGASGSADGSGAASGAERPPPYLAGCLEVGEDHPDPAGHASSRSGRRPRSPGQPARSKTGVLDVKVTKVEQVTDRRARRLGARPTQPQLHALLRARQGRQRRPQRPRRSRRAALRRRRRQHPGERHARFDERLQAAARARSLPKKFEPGARGRHVPGLPRARQGRSWRTSASSRPTASTRSTWVGQGRRRQGQEEATKKKAKKADG